MIFFGCQKVPHNFSSLHLKLSILEIFKIWQYVLKLRRFKTITRMDIGLHLEIWSLRDCQNPILIIARYLHMHFYFIWRTSDVLFICSIELKMYPLCYKNKPTSFTLCFTIFMAESWHNSNLINFKHCVYYYIYIVLTRFWVYYDFFYS